MKNLCAFGLIATLTTALGCQSNNAPYAGSLADNVGESFSGCNESEIKFLSAKHNFQLAFRPCGANAFSTYRWSPDGTRIYFQLVLSSYVMNANAPDKATLTVPTPQTVAEAAWLTPTRIAAPVVSSDEADDSLRMAVFQLPAEPTDPDAVTAGQLTYHDLPGLLDVDHLQRGKTPNELLFTAQKASDGPRTIYRMDTSSGELGEAFPWLKAPMETFTYTARAGAILLGHQGAVAMFDETEQAEVGRWEHAIRGALHPDGRWLLLEYEGPPTSIYFQRTWDELSDQARQRELARAERFADGLPEWSPRETRPPGISVVDRSSNKRWAFTAFQGNHVQWYPGADNYVSFFLWGFEGKQLKRNVALGNLTDRLNAVSEGRDMMGVEPFENMVELLNKAEAPASPNQSEGTPPNGATSGN